MISSRRTASGACCAIALMLMLGFAIACSDDDDPGGAGGATGSGGASGASGADANGGSSSGGSSSGGSSSGGSSGGGAAGSSGSAAGGSAGAGAAGGAGGAGGATQAFWADFAAAVCHHYFSCPGEAYQSNRLRATAKTEAQCKSRLLQLTTSRPRIAALNRATAAGTLRFQPDVARQCVEAAARCNYPLDPMPPDEILFEDVTVCREVFDGTVPANGACDRNEECTGNARCVFASTGTCAGTCTPSVGKGGTCTSNRGCSAVSPSAWPVCYSGSCVEVAVAAPAMAGGQCGNFEVDTMRPCADGLWCPYGAFSSPGQCQQTFATGQPCDARQGIPCTEGACIGNVCTAYVSRETAGQSCDGTTTFCNSFAGLLCIGNSCVTMDGSQNPPCRGLPWFERAICNPEPIAPTGGTCTNNDQCESGVCRRQVCVASLCSTK